MVDAYNVFDGDNNDDQTDWEEAEEKTADAVDGERQIASGALDKYPGDVKSDNRLIECKSTKSSGLYLSRKQIEKACREAREINKRPGIMIEFKDPDDFEGEWIAIPMSDYQILCEEAES